MTSIIPRSRLDAFEGWVPDVGSRPTITITITLETTMADRFKHLAKRAEDVDPDEPHWGKRKSRRLARRRLKRETDTLTLEQFDEWVDSLK